MNSYQSWAIFLAILGALSWYYLGQPKWLTRRNPQRLKSRTARQVPEPSSGRSKTKAKQDKDRDTGRDTNRSADQSSTSDANLNKKRKIAAPRPSEDANPQSSRNETPRQGTTVTDDDDEVSENADFAKKMAMARMGTQLRSADKLNTTKKAGQPRIQGGHQPGNETDSPSLSTGPSSVGGADADDDFSPALSPSLPATTDTAATKAADVSDMLAPAAKAPSVIRLTGSSMPTTAARPKQSSKVFEPAETKKQRQHRLKREAKRAEADEVERERRKLMEQQIRGARMAEGTSAQTRTSAFKPTGNPWSANPTKSSPEAVEDAPHTLPSLLDTFDTQSGSKTSDTAPSNSTTEDAVPRDQAKTNGSDVRNAKYEERAIDSPMAGSAKEAWTRELPLEEEQLRLIHSSDDPWTTVSKRDKKKIGKPQESQGNDTSDTNGAESRPVNSTTVQRSTSPRPALPDISNSYQQLKDFGLQDSDWAAG